MGSHYEYKLEGEYMIQGGDICDLDGDLVQVRARVEGGRALIEYMDGETSIVERDKLEEYDPDKSMFEKLRDLWHENV